MADMQVGNLHAGDIAVIVIYLVGSMALGLFVIAKSKTSIESLFLAGRSMVWWPIGLSLFASNIGSVNYVGIAGDAAAAGFAVILFEWNAVFLLILLGWIFLPVYIASGIYTMPEYLHWRFGGKRLRIYLSVIALLTYVFSTVSSDLYSGGLFMNQTLTINLYAAVALLLFIALIFTGLGGLETVIITDSLAVFVMVVGGFIMCVMGFVRVGGLSGLEYKYMHAVPNTSMNSNTTCGYPDEDAWHIFRHPWNSSYPSVGLILRTTFGSLWYWCANQVLVQRALAAKDITHAKAACVFAGYLKLLPMFLMVFPGMISRALFPNEVGCADPDVCMAVCGSELGCTNIALPKLVLELLPIGLRGLMVASVIAAVVSTLTSIFNSSSAIFTMDIWVNIRPGATNRELLIVGRVFTVVLVGVSIMWIPIMSQAGGGQIFQYATTITGYLGAPTCAMFFLAMFWGRINEQGAFWGMIIAQVWGMMRFVLDLIYPAPPCGEPDNRPLIVSGWHAYYHTISEILLAFIVATVISLATKAPPKERLAGLTYWTRFEKPLKDQELEEKVKARTLLASTKASLAEQKTILDQQYPDISGYSNESVHSQADAKGRERSMSSTTSSSSTNPDIGDSEFESVNAEKEKFSLRKRFVQTVCGSDSTTADTDDLVDDVEEHSHRVASIKQQPFWRDVMNINAVLVMFATVFLCGFFY